MLQFNWESSYDLSQTINIVCLFAWAVIQKQKCQLDDGKSEIEALAQIESSDIH